MYMELILVRLRVLGKSQEEIYALTTSQKVVDILSQEHFKNAACKPSCPTALLDFNNEIYLGIDCTNIGENENSQFF